MASTTSARVVLLWPSVALGLGVMIAALPSTARASDPDIPRLQVDAERGSINEEVALGAAYFAGRGVPHDEKRAAFWYEKAANAGDPVAQKEIGYFYAAGIGVNRDPAQAVRWFQRAAAGGLISAKVNLGVAYLVGEGVKKDTALAADLFHQAYAQGDGMAALYLGEMSFNGIGVPRDEAAGEHWYEAGAKLHDPRAEFNLAELLTHRQKSGADIKRAVKLLRESSSAGLVVAKHQLAVTLMKHPELASSPHEAATLLKESAEAGQWASSVALGLLSRDGMMGVPADPKAAYYHYRVAVLQGGKEAMQVVADELDALASRLGPQQTAAIDADASAWFENHHLVLQFVSKEGAKYRKYPVYAVARPDDGMYAGRLLPNDPSAEYRPTRKLSVN